MANHDLVSRLYFPAGFCDLPAGRACLASPGATAALPCRRQPGCGRADFLGGKSQPIENAGNYFLVHQPCNS